jgi:hypothetical protein
MCFVAHMFDADELSQFESPRFGYSSNEVRSQCRSQDCFLSRHVLLVPVLASQGYTKQPTHLRKLNVYR